MSQMRCSNPECRSTDIDWNESSGDAVCVRCGTVCEESTIVASVEFTKEPVPASSASSSQRSANPSGRWVRTTGPLGDRSTAFYVVLEKRRSPRANEKSSRSRIVCDWASTTSTARIASLSWPLKEISRKGEKRYMWSALVSTSCVAGKSPHTCSWTSRMFCRSMFIVWVLRS